MTQPFKDYIQSLRGDGYGIVELAYPHDIEALMYVQEEQLDKINQELSLTNTTVNIAQVTTNQNSGRNGGNSGSHQHFMEEGVIFVVMDVEDKYIELETIPLDNYTKIIATQW